MRVLFISYYFHPSNLVGAKRISYWAKHFKNYTSNQSETTLITAQPNATTHNEEIDNIFIVKPLNKIKGVRIDNGSEWYGSLKLFIINHLNNYSYDYCIVTGNPFGHFFIVRELNKFHVKTILDFRDPFAINPRSLDTLKNRIKSWFFSILEYYFINTTYRSIVVNKQCLELIRFRKILEKKIEIIDNGFDETILKEVYKKRRFSNKNRILLAYSGSIFKNRDPFNLIKVIDQRPELMGLHLIGNAQNIYNSKKVVLHGILSYEENLKLLQEKDILVVLGTGHQFESSTKVFDYIALKKPILVIFSEWQGKGAIFDILKTYPLAIFSKNTTNDINNAINEILYSLDEFESNIHSYDISRYSRKNGLLKLVNLLR